MSESKIVLTERLRREGRWEKASEFKDKAIAEFRADGMKRTEAAEAAWIAMAEAFPALSVGVLPVETGACSQTGPASVAGPIPWKDLPTDATFDEEVRWVHQQYILIVEDSSQCPIIHWDRATAKAPSTGACSLARWAAENRTAFYKDLLPKTMARLEGIRGTDADKNFGLVDDPGLEDLQAMLDEMEAHADAVLRTDLPKVVQLRVGNLLSNWSQEQQVKLTDDARAKLDTGICSLIRDAIRTFTPVGNP